MRAAILALMIASGAVAQTAIVPLSALCPTQQITQLTKGTILGTSTIAKISCIALDSSVSEDTTVTPPILRGTVPIPPVVTLKAGKLECTLDPTTAPSIRAICTDQGVVNYMTMVTPVASVTSGMQGSVTDGPDSITWILQQTATGLTWQAATNGEQHSGTFGSPVTISVVTTPAAHCEPYFGVFQAVAPGPLISGSVDGTNATFVLPASVLAMSQQVFLNGSLQTPGVDYTITSGNVIVFAKAPASGSIVMVYYRA